MSSVVGANQETGFLEICSAAEGRILGQKLLTVSISGVARQYTLPLNACTAAIELPAGEVRVSQEPLEGTEVADIDAYALDAKGERESRLVAKMPLARTAYATVVAGDVSGQTIVMYTLKPHD